ncbi:MAG: hypothetical protein K6G64_04820 [Eubacterium sp.]|nr:hypothetical protein [Eubacterium sp.]
MRKNFMKKVTAVALSLTMVIGAANIVSAAHAANGSNIASKVSWDSFSVRDDLNGKADTEWHIALQEEIKKAKAAALADFEAGKIDQTEYNALVREADGYESYTQGYFSAAPTASGFDFYAKNTGWDGEYYNGNLVADNPWGMTVQLLGNGVSIEKGRKYTVSFKIKSTLKGKKKVVDENGDVVKVNGKEVEEDNYIKHISFKLYDTVSKGGPAVDLDSVTGATTAGMIELDSSKDEWKTITANVTIPAKYGSDYMGIMFALGARQVSYPDEVAMSGYVSVSDFKIVAGNQYKVTYTGNGKSYASYVNGGSRASVNSSIASKLGKKKYTIDCYTLNGAKYNFGAAVNKDITLAAHYVKTKKPKKVKISSAKSPSKKKMKVTVKKAANAVGYQIKYSSKKSMKRAKSKSTTKTAYTIKKLKSGSFIYIQVRGYNLDSLGNRVYGKWSKKKIAVVK